MPIPCNRLSLQKSFAPACQSVSRLTGIFFASLLGLLIALFAAPVFAQTNEGFDAGGKSSYAAANVTLGSGSWHLDDALTGNLAGDAKIGSYSARVRNTGKVRMNFNLSSAGTVAVTHAVYGADGASN
jgi:hypothetical protein